MTNHKLCSVYIHALCMRAASAGQSRRCSTLARVNGHSFEAYYDIMCMSVGYDQASRL